MCVGQREREGEGGGEKVREHVLLGRLAEFFLVDCARSAFIQVCIYAYVCVYMCVYTYMYIYI